MPVDDGLTPSLRRLAAALRDQQLLTEMGLAAERAVQDNTRQGLDVEGNPFKAAGSASGGSPYSPGWQRQREAKNLPTEIVNLAFDTRSGMLRQIESVVNERLSTVVVYFRTPEAEAKAGYAHDFGRVFFALSDSTMDAITDVVGDHLNQLLLKGP